MTEHPMEPFVYATADEVGKHGAFPFPFLADHVPDGWTSLGPAYRYYAAQSGLSDGLALSMGELQATVKQVMAAHPGETIGWALTRRSETAVLVQAYLKQGRVH